MRILLISATPPDETVTRALENDGHSVTHTSDSQIAIEKITRGSTDIAIVNLLLRQLGALELLGIIRANNHELPIITTGAATTNGKQKEPPALSVLGIHAHLTEPLTPDTLLTAIRSIPQTVTSNV